jgi:hypothetical protein
MRERNSIPSARLCAAMRPLTVDRCVEVARAAAETPPL